MFVLDKEAGPWDVALGSECLACYTDGYYYLAILGEISDTYASVTFDANRGFKHKDAPASGKTMMAPLSDICNVSWGIQNLDAEYTGRIIKVYSTCVFMKQLEDGRLVIYEDGDKDLEHKITYDCLRFFSPAEPFFPAAAEVTASVTGRKSTDLNTLRQRLMQSIDRGLGIAKGGDYEVFGRTVYVSPHAARRQFLDGLYNRFLAAVEPFAREKHVRTPDALSDRYDDIAGFMGNIAMQLADILANAGLAITRGKYMTRYSPAISTFGYNLIIDEYNKLVDKYNQKVYDHKQNVKYFGSNSFLDPLTEGALMSSNPKVTGMYKLDIAGKIKNDMDITLYTMVYTDFTRAVNNYVGARYFDLSVRDATGSTDELWFEYEDMNEETKKSPAGLDILLRMLEINPYDRSPYTSLIIYHAYPGCGLTEFIEELNPGQTLAAQMKYDLLKEWLLGSEAAIYPRSSSNETLALLSERFERLEMARDNAAPLFDLKTLTECVYALHDIAYDLMLNRFSYGQPPDNPNHPTLLQKLDGIRNRLFETQSIPAGQTYKEALLAVCQPLRELIEQDSRTVRGRVFESHEEMKKVEAQTREALITFHNTDFLKPDSVSAIDRMIDAHQYSELLQPYKEKARRAADLAIRLRDFLRSVEGRQYHSRQEHIYDIMQADILNNERHLLWMKAEKVHEWYEEQTDIAHRVFGKWHNDLADANEYYYDVMDSAWVYQEYLNEKNNKQAGFFKKLGTAISGIGKKDYEPAYNAVTENGAKALTPLAPGEREATRSYWQYAHDEKERLFEEYCSRYDPTAIAGRKRMTEIKTTINSYMNESALQGIKHGLLNGDWKPQPRPEESASKVRGFGIDDITEPLSEGEIRVTYRARRPGVTITLPKTVYVKNEKMKFDVSGVTVRMQAYKAFVSIYAAGASYADYGDYGYLKKGVSNCLFTAPQNPGAYEMRVYERETDRDVLVYAAFEVVNDRQEIQPAANTVSGSDVPVRQPNALSVTLAQSVYKVKEPVLFTVNGITAQMQANKAFAAIYNAGAPHRDYGAYCYPPQGASNCQLVAPKKPGAYEIRVYKKDLEYTDETFLTSVPFTVM